MAITDAAAPTTLDLGMPGVLGQQPTDSTPDTVQCVSYGVRDTDIIGYRTAVVFRMVGVRDVVTGGHFANTPTPVV